MKKSFLILLLTGFSVLSFSQKWKLTRYEAYVGIGPANYFGDIGGSAEKNNWYGIRDISPLGTRPSIIAGARYKIKQNINVKLNLGIVMLGGTDKGSRNEIGRNGGFSFNTYGFEHSLQFEYALLAEDVRQRSFAIFNRRGMLNNFSKKSFYFFAGIGGMLFYPQFKGTPTPIDIVNKSVTYAAVIPVGIGLKMNFSNRIAIGGELGLRYAFSDYLDGVTSSISKFNDIYYFTTFNLIYRIKTSRKGYPILFKSY